MSQTNKTNIAREAGQNTTTNHQQRETVGRAYIIIEYLVHSRRIGGDGKWFGASRYTSLDNAKQAIADMGKPILGGMVAFGSGEKDRFEYRIVRSESKRTVEHVEVRSI